MDQIDPVFRHEDIERLAYELWQSRGCPVGSPQADWERARDLIVMSGAAGRFGSASDWNVPGTFTSTSEFPCTEPHGESPSPSAKKAG